MVSFLVAGTYNSAYWILVDLWSLILGKFRGMPIEVIGEEYDFMSQQRENRRFLLIPLFSTSGNICRRIQRQRGVNCSDPSLIHTCPPIGDQFFFIDMITEIKYFK